MSGDKEIENQNAPDFEDDEIADVADSAGFPEEDIGAGDFAEDDFEVSAGGEEDFVEEDWEAYDEESFIDDSDGDGTAERKAAFNKLLIGAAVAVIIAGGTYLVMSSSEEENMGLPEMVQVTEPVEVDPDQKVEFHAETKVQPKDAFGVTYGKQETIVEEAPPEETRQEGLLNDPQALARLRNREAAIETEYVIVPESNGIQDEDGRLPMPAPMAQAESAVSEGGSEGVAADNGMRPRPEPANGLIPMPERLRGPSDGIDAGASAGLPRVPDIARSASNDTAELAATPDQAAPGAPDAYGAQQAPAPMDAAAAGDVADLSRKLDQISGRLDRIEGDREQLDGLQSAVDKLESRLAKLEKAPSRPAASAPSTPSSPRVTAVPRPAARPSGDTMAQGWVLKSAQPGEAMVARKGSSDIYSVSVGDDFAGIGKVTGIFVENGRWIVQGTSGRISQ